MNRHNYWGIFTVNKEDKLRIFNQLRHSLKTIKNKFDRLDCDTERALTYKSHFIKDFKSSFPLINTLELPYKYFLTSLQTIPASPERKLLFNKTYEVPSKKILDKYGATTDISYNKAKLLDPYSPYIWGNVSKEWIKELILHFITVAKDVRKERINKEQTIGRAKKNSIFFCIGDPGVGKTTFINNMFSVYSEHLRNEKVIWVRLDLNDASQMKDDFEEAFLLKTIRILHDKYSEEIDFHDDGIKGYVNTRWASTTGKGMITVTDIDNLFKKFFTLRRYNIEDQLDLSFIDVVIDYLIEKLEYSFIFIIDGLDRVTLDSVRNDKFVKWCRNLVNFISQKTFKDAVYIIVMREISLIDALSHFTEDENLKTYKIIKILPPDLEGMMDKKFAIAKEMILKNKDEKYDWLESKHIDALKNAILHYTFTALLNINIDDVAKQGERLFHEKGYELVNGICANNFRVLMRFFRQLLLHVFSSYDASIEILVDENIKNRYSIFKGKEYKVKRVLINGREESTNYSVPYTYKVYNNEVLFEPNNNVEPLIPNIFNFIDELEDGKTEMKQENRILVKLHIISFLLNNDCTAKKRRVIDYFSERLGYSKLFLKYEIDEMIYSGILQPRALKGFVKENNYTIQLTELGKYIFKSLIYDEIYHEIIVDDTPLPQQMLTHFDPINLGWVNVDIDKYVSTKIKSVLYFIAVLKEVERQEEEYYNTNTTREKRSFEEEGYKIVEKIEKNINRDIQKMLGERTKDSPKRFLESLNRTFGTKVG